MGLHLRAFGPRTIVADFLALIFFIILIWAAYTKVGPNEVLVIPAASTTPATSRGNPSSGASAW